METLKITLFGHVTVIHPTRSAPLKLSHGNQAFLAYILLQKHLIPRDILMDVFWGKHSPDRAHSSLTTAVWRLRHLLEPTGVIPGTYVITKKSGEVGFNWDSYHWVDSASFEKQIYPLLRKPISELSGEDVKLIEETLTLYRGDLLESMYDDWALRERERFRSLHLNCLTHLMQYFAAHVNFEQSIAIGHEILRRDPLREETHRALMNLYVKNGQQTLALRQYDRCRVLLNQELGISPLEETQTIYQQIVANSPSSIPTLRPAPNPEIAQLIHELHSVKQTLSEITKALDRISLAANRLIVSSDNSVTEL